tara:strand:- start:6908 stop:7174 length:267 start_codon:yes stop_codon:yes gene_type:complete
MYNLSKGLFMENISDLIKLIVSSLVDNPDEINITEVKGDSTTVYELKVAKDDLGKIIGKQGKTAKAIRTLLGAAAAKDKRRAVLEIIE